MKITSPMPTQTPYIYSFNDHSHRMTVTSDESYGKEGCISFNVPFQSIFSFEGTPVWNPGWDSIYMTIEHCSKTAKIKL